MTYPPEVVLEVERLARAGAPRRAIARDLELSYSTVRRWLSGSIPIAAAWAKAGIATCPRCGAREHVFARSPSAAYAYLLAVYLGDGHLSSNRQEGNNSCALCVSLDRRYPGIVDEVRTAIESVRGRRPWIGRDPHKSLYRMSSFWKQWPCWLPQHGPGRKHCRKIQLTDWQWVHVRAEPMAFLRGLIHTDGWRGLNRVNVKGKAYVYPRYQFSNRSDDIRGLFTEVCDLVGVDWRHWGRWHISVARRRSVAKLDQSIGPKT